MDLNACLHCIALGFLGCATIIAEETPGVRPVPDLGGGTGWPGYVITSGVATAAVAPALGGRLIRFTLDGVELLRTDPAWHGKILASEVGRNSFWQYAGYGGMRFMPAPQAFWKVSGAPIPSWPPPPAIDYGSYEPSTTPDGLRCHGPVENNPLWRCAGMQIRYHWRLAAGSARVLVEAILTNYSLHPQSWGLWDIVQARVEGGEVFWPQRRQGESRFGPPGVMMQSGARSSAGITEDATSATVGFRIGNSSFKASSDTDGGWLALYRPEVGIVLAKRFRYDPNAWLHMTYPEGGSTLAVFVPQSGGYVELESMSPVVDLDPGESTTSIQELAACRVASRPTSIESWGALVTAPAISDGRLRASLGVFDAGMILVSGNGRNESFPVSPTQPVIVDVAWDQTTANLKLQPAGSGPALVIGTVGPGR